MVDHCVDRCKVHHNFDYWCSWRWCCRQRVVRTSYCLRYFKNRVGFLIFELAVAVMVTANLLHEKPISSTYKFFFGGRAAPPPVPPWRCFSWFWLRLPSAQKRGLFCPLISRFRDEIINGSAFIRFFLKPFEVLIVTSEGNHFLAPLACRCILPTQALFGFVTLFHNSCL